MVDYEKLEQFDNEDGFCWNIRYRVFLPEKGLEYLQFLRTIDLGDADKIDRRLVQSLWDIPLFLEYRMRDFEENQLLSEEGLNQLRQICNKISAEIERILGHE